MIAVRRICGGPGADVLIVGLLPEYAMDFYTIVTDDGWTGTTCSVGLPKIEDIAAASDYNGTDRISS